MEIRGSIPTHGLTDGIVTVAGGVITSVAAVPEGADPPVSADVILPGLIDIHCHGGGGHSFATFSAAEARAAAAFHAAHGTTSMLASLVTATPADLLAQVRTLAPLVAEGTLLGLHLEGPFLSPARRGAHDPSLLLDPDQALVAALLSAAAGAIKVVTIAPERTGATAVTSMLADAGVTVAFGHTDTDYADMAAALAGAGTRAGSGGALVTHLGNAMAPVHHRAAGPVAAALIAAAADSAWVEVIADGIHVDAGFTRLVFATAAPGRVILVTDAMAAAGMPDGAYALGPLRVAVSGGVARLAGADGVGEGSIAGGTRTLIEVVATAVASGVPLAEAVRAASEAPARVLGLPSLGVLGPGRAADLVITDAALRVRRVLRAGRFLLLSWHCCYLGTAVIVALLLRSAALEADPGAGTTVVGVDADERTRRGHSFGAVAAAYAEHRPDYPADAVRWCVAPTGREPAGLRVLDLGAGTGKLTAVLAGLGTDVTAVEPDQGMLTELRQQLPSVRVLDGTAETIPLPDESVDAVLCGQSMHWFDMSRALPEIARVLAPGGVLGALWNSDDDRIAWVAGLRDAAEGAAAPTLSRRRQEAASFSLDQFGPERFTPTERAEFPNAQPRTADSLLATIATHSQLLVMPPDERDRVIGQIRAYLASRPETASGEFELPMITSALRSVRFPVSAGFLPPSSG